MPDKRCQKNQSHLPTDVGSSIKITHLDAILFDSLIEVDDVCAVQSGLQVLQHETYEV